MKKPLTKITAILITTAILLTALTACSDSPEPPPLSGSNVVLGDSLAPIDADPLTSEETAVFVPALADFSLELFRRTFGADTKDDNGHGNNLISPLSVMLALAMTANGADTQTLSEMETVLGRTGLTIADLNRLLAAFVSNLPSETKAKLNIANSIWFRDCGSFTANEDFLRTNFDYYAAQIIQADFDSPATVDDINAWVAHHTDDMITVILDEISPDVVMYLINAIVFDSQWAEPYKEHQIREHNFTTPDGRVQRTDFMWSTEQDFIVTDGATGFLKPYAGGHYSFAALLPDEDVDIADFVAGLTGDALISALGSAGRPQYAEGVSVGLPKFTFEFELGLNDVLSDMGMPTAFCRFSADFSRLGQSGANLFINVMHKTFIEVDEVGTRAAAVTRVDVVNESAPVYESVILDRPFVFMIVDNATNLPIFIGAMTEIAD
jgi:serpin B